MFDLKKESEILGRYGNNLLLIQFILSLAIFLGSLLYFIYVYYKKEEVRPHSHQQEDKPKVSDENTNASNPEHPEMSTNKLMNVIDTIMENIMEHDLKEIQEMQLDILNDTVKKPIYNNFCTESEKAAQNMENILNTLLDEGESNSDIIDKKMSDLHVEKNNNYENCIENYEVQASISSIDFDYYPDMEVMTNCPTKSDLNAAPNYNNCNFNTSSYSESTIARTKHLGMNNTASKTSLAVSKLDCSNVSGDVSNSSKKSMRRSANTATTIKNKKPFVTYCSPHSTFPPLESLRKAPTNKCLSKLCARTTALTTTSSVYSSGYARKQMKTSNDMSVGRKKVGANKWNSN